MYNLELFTQYMPSEWIHSIHVLNESSKQLTWKWPLIFHLILMESHRDQHHFANEETEAATAATAKSLQSCPTLCDPRDGSPPGSAIPGIFQARTPEWVAISFSNALKWKVKVKLLSCVRLLATPWTAALQAPPSMGFSRQEYWSGLPLPSPKLRLETCKDLLGVPQPVKSGVQVLAQTDLPWETGII